jgi:phospholipid-transporting ATPase
MGTLQAKLSETNLKIKQGLPETATLITIGAIEKLHGTIKSELPNNSMYTFEALLKINGQEYPVTPQQLLLRVFNSLS